MLNKNALFFIQLYSFRVFFMFSGNVRIFGGGGCFSFYLSIHLQNLLEMWHPISNGSFVFTGTRSDLLAWIKGNVWLLMHNWKLFYIFSWLALDSNLYNWSARLISAVCSTPSGSSILTDCVYSCTTDKFPLTVSFLPTLRRYLLFFCLLFYTFNIFCYNTPISGVYY